MTDPLSHADDRAVLRLLLSLAIRAVEAEEGSLLVLRPDRNELEFVMILSSDGEASSALEGQSVPVGKGITGLAALTGEVQLGAPTFVVGQEIRDTGGPQAVIAAPMMLRGACVGVMTGVSYDRQRRFGTREAQLYAQISTVAALVVSQRQQLAQLVEPSLVPAHAALQSVRVIAANRPDLLAHTTAMLAAIESIAVASASPTGSSSAQ
jgi:GAF domain-containing protein